MVKPEPADRPLRLTGKKGDYTFEMWVEVEGRPLEVYGVSEGEDGILEAWIVSEIGKDYEVYAKSLAGYQEFPDLKTSCKVDGISINNLVTYASGLHRDGSTLKFNEYRISENMVQKLQFSKPVLTEQETPDLEMTSLATIELKFARCLRYTRYGHQTSFRGAAQRSTTQVNEQSKKAAKLISSMTSFTEPEFRAPTRFCSTSPHPQDIEDGYFTMRLRYASKDLLQALEHIPLDIDIQAGEAGLESDHPIVLDDDEPPAGSSRVERQGSVKLEPTGSARPPGNAVAEIVDEIAETQKKLEQLQQRKRAAETGQEDSKDNILKQASKKLKMAKGKDNGVVDLTADDD